MNAALRGILVASTLAAAMPAAAQTVDYTNAEAMFGEPVTVSVTGKPQRASEAPVAITILTADDLRRSGAVDVPSALRFVPGLDVRQYGRFNSAVGIRGYNTAMNPRVLVLVDGRQVYQDDYGYTQWSAIPVTMAEIRQIEIIRGPNAALYGFNAVSGVINIVTYDPLRDRKNSVSAVGGTRGSLYGEGVATLQPSEDVGLRFSAKGARSDEFRARPGEPVPQEPIIGTGSADLRARLNESVQLDLSASLGRQETDTFVEIGAYVPNIVDNSHLRARLTATTPLGFAELDAYHNRSELDAGIFSQRISWDQAVTVVKASNLLRLGSEHTIRVGGEYRHNSISSPTAYGGELTSDLLAASLGWNWDIAPALTLTNAIRFDTVKFDRNEDDLFVPGLGFPFGDRRYEEVSYNSGLLWRATEYDTVRLGTGRALQLPSLFNYGFKGEAEGVRVFGSRHLEPSAVTNYEASYTRLLPVLSSSLGVTVFHQQTDVTIGSPFGSGFSILPGGIPVLAARNFDGSRAFGGEIGLDGAHANWRWNLSYSLAHVRDESPDVLLRGAPSVAYEAQTPTHVVIGGLGYTYGALELDAQARWQSRFADFAVMGVGIERIEVDDYLTVSARLGYRLNERATASLLAEQANAGRQTQTGGRDNERRILAGLKLEF